MADELIDEPHREAVVRAAIVAVCRFSQMSGEYFMAADIAYRVPCNDGWYAAEWTIGNWQIEPRGVLTIRELFGNPFRPATLDPTWLTLTVVALARSIYGERGFDRLPILAGALEEAACSEASILDHCRSPAEHVRGCWVVDLLLGKP